MVDAPELTPQAECFGREAMAFNRALVDGQRVEVQYDGPCTDRFGRLLAYVWVGGREVNRMPMDHGQACLLHITPGGNDRLNEFRMLERTAQREHRGLLGHCSAMPPRCARRTSGDWPPGR